MASATSRSASVVIMGAVVLTTIALGLAVVSIVGHALAPAALILAAAAAALAWRAPATTLIALVAFAPYAQTLSAESTIYVANPWFELMWCGASSTLLLRSLRSQDVLARRGNGWVFWLWLLTLVSAAHAVYVRHRLGGYISFPPDLHAVGGTNFWEPTWGEALRPAITLTECLVAFVVARSLLTTADVTKALRLWLVAFVGVAAFGLVDFLAVDRSHLFTGTNRAISLFSGPNVFATYCAMGISLAAFVWTRLRGRDRLLGATAAITGLVSLLATRSLGGALAALIGLAVFAALCWVPAKRFRWAAAAGALALAAAALWLLLSGGWERANDLSHGRLELWAAGWRMLARFPLSGVGLGNFYRDLSDFAGAHAGSAHEHAHSALVQIAAEQGLIAVLIGAAALVTLARRARWKPIHANDLRPAFAYAALAAGAHQLVDSTYLVVTVSMQLWFFLGVATAPGSCASVRDADEEQVGK